MTNRKRMGILVLALAIVLSSFIGRGLGPKGAYAEEGLWVIRDMEVNKKEIKQGESFRIDVKFGGPGVQVTTGHREEIAFHLENTKIDLPKDPIDLRDRRTNTLLGRVTFEGDKGILVFNENVSGLDDVEGAFFFTATGYWNQSFEESGKATIEIRTKNITKTLPFLYEGGGTATENVYSKEGVWKTQGGNHKVDWVFTFNGALNPTGDKDVTVELKDHLPETMTWDNEFNESCPYVVEVEGAWRSLGEAKNMGIEISLVGQELTIRIPHYIRTAWGFQRPLDRKEITVRLTAEVLEEVMDDPRITHVSNTSRTPKITGVDWPLDPKDNYGEVEIQRSGGWAAGTKKGEVRIYKYIENTEIPVEGVIFHLLDQGGTKCKELKTDKDGKVRVTGLKVGKYFLKEVRVPDHIVLTEEEKIPIPFEIKESDKEGKEFKIYNRKKEIVEKVEVKGSKTWKDDDNREGRRPKEITVRLLADGVEADRQVVTSAKGWAWSFPGLKKYEGGKEITYTLKEDPVPGYTAEVSGYDIINTCTSKKTEVSVKKVWEDENNREGKRPKEVTVRLLADGVDTGKKLILDDSNQWKGTFKDLPLDKAGKKILYSLKEVTVDGYSPEITKVGATSFQVTNRFTPEKVEVKGSKTWKDDDNREGRRPKEITVRLLADGVEADRQVVTSAKGWAWSFPGLKKYEGGKEITYTLKEDPVPGYTAEVSGYDIINTCTSKKTEVSVKKVWEDENNREGKRPKEVTVRLLADGVDTGKKLILGDSNQWKGTFDHLPEYQGGKRIDYGIREVRVPGYKGKITGNPVSGYTIRNFHLPKKPEKPGSPKDPLEPKAPTPLKNPPMPGSGIPETSKNPEVSHSKSPTVPKSPPDFRGEDSGSPKGPGAEESPGVIKSPPEKRTGAKRSPKTFDPGPASSILSGSLCLVGLGVLKRKYGAKKF